MKRAWLLALLVGVLCVNSPAQWTTDVLGSHDLSPGGTSPIKGRLNSGCQYCHAPHSGITMGSAPLWAQTLSKQTYTTYTSTTLKNLTTQPPLGGDSNLCLSCHDGTVAPGQTVPYGRLRMTGNMLPQDKFGSNLGGSHPFSFRALTTDSPDLVTTLISSHKTADPQNAVKLINNNVECTSCHNPHVQAIDTVAQQFLVRDGSNGALCLACHEPGARQVSNQNNPLSPWTTSIHANTNNKLSQGAGLGSYTTVGANSCISCHVPHSALGGAELLRQPASPVPNMDSATQNCITCHNGGSNISPAIPNVYAEFAKTGHPYPAGNNTHSAGEATVLENNRHATCVDCHNAHGSQQVTSFDAPPKIRISQTSTKGLGVDGTTQIDPAVNQYENCLRCHGPSSGKTTLTIFGYAPAWAAENPGDSLNVIYEFNSSSTSRHPVMLDRSSGYPQPSLRAFMVQLDGKTQGRSMGQRIFCTDCHNSDDNREGGGTGPNGPHGSTFSHILERRYEYSQVASGAGAGTTITNLIPNPPLDPSANGPYSMCAKCHDLTNIVSDASFLPDKNGKGGHATHINDGFSCSICHTSHGMGGTAAGISGERMVNFDLKVVAPNNGTLAYSHSANTCTLTCHGYAHYSNGSVTPALAKPGVK
ncbi:hypothetical protein Acid345_0741 [Candidatus Koribacter versatilis Ellin345]|uniref:Cytochrome c domain-containing protein n=1 Tax=Koribacter versatilis (strain Ellin345) TaxID=204669 RepID=Q1ITQ4_KORVE|nr:cytochrome c3 family protein [Candidatus Koribacter versatilis]ABF39746.1 hypothetical protein Acid345_0741 [Candidatus Koribacter versatilis Ellin345]